MSVVGTDIEPLTFVFEDDGLVPNNPMPLLVYKSAVDVANGHPEKTIEGLFGAEQVLWVRHHHERHDGRGYPDGLSGDSIPDGARILAVADSWDVMISGRPYKAALSTEQALQECRRLAGTQFAPDVVHALGQLWDSGAFTDGLGHLAAYD